MGLQEKDKKIGKKLSKLIRICLGIKEKPVFILYHQSKEGTAKGLAQILDLPIFSYELSENKKAVQKRSKEIPKKVKRILKECSGLILVFNPKLKEDTNKFFALILDQTSRLKIKTLLIFANLEELYHDYTLLNPSFFIKKGSNLISFFRTFKKPIRVKVVASGTDLSFQIDPQRRWEIDCGISLPGDFAQLPTGEIYCCPIEESINGKIESKRNQKLVWLKIKKGKIIECSPELKKELNQHPELLYLGEWGIGINDKIKKITGKVYLDEKKYGTCHFGFGDNYGLGQRARVDYHFDLVIENPTVSLNGKIRLKDQRWQLDSIG